MKKYLFLAALMVIGLSSCSSEHEDAMADDITEADAFVASEQFQEFQQSMRKDVTLIRERIQKLTKVEKEELRKALTTSAQSVEDVNSACMLASEMLNIDYKQHIADRMADYISTFSGKTFPTQELLKAIQRYNTTAIRVQLTRSGSNEAARMECENYCGALYSEVYYSCLGDYVDYSYPEHNWNEDQRAWLTFWNCTEQAEWATADCFDSCKNL